MREPKRGQQRRDRRGPLAVRRSNSEAKLTSRDADGRVDLDFGKMPGQLTQRTTVRVRSKVVLMERQGAEQCLRPFCFVVPLSQEVLQLGSHTRSSPMVDVSALLGRETRREGYVGRAMHCPRNRATRYAGSEEDFWLLTAVPRHRDRQMTDLLRSTAERAIRYLSDLPQRSVAPSTEALQALRQFDEPLP